MFWSINIKSGFLMKTIHFQLNSTQDQAFFFFRGKNLLSCYDHKSINSFRCYDRKANLTSQSNICN